MVVIVYVPARGAGFAFGIPGYRRLNDGQVLFGVVWLDGGWRASWLRRGFDAFQLGPPGPAAFFK